MRKFKNIRLKSNEEYNKLDDWIFDYTKNENMSVNEVISKIRETIDRDKPLDTNIRSLHQIYKMMKRMWSSLKLCLIINLFKVEENPSLVLIEHTIILQYFRNLQEMSTSKSQKQ